MTTFAQEMLNRLDSFEKRADAIGSNMTQLSKRTAIARATLQRWKERPPQSITKVDEIEAELVRMEVAHAKTVTGATAAA